MGLEWGFGISVDASQNPPDLSGLNNNKKQGNLMQVFSRLRALGGARAARPSPEGASLDRLPKELLGVILGKAGLWRGEGMRARARALCR